MKREPDDSAAPTVLGANQIAAYAADLIDLEASIESLQDGKKQLYATIREQHGRVAADAIKNAIRLKRMNSEKRGRIEATDVETARVLAIIESVSAPAPARTIASRVPDEDDQSGDGIAAPTKQAKGGSNPPPPSTSQLEETQRQGESEQRRDDGSRPVFVQEGSVEAEGQGRATREQGAGEPSQPALPNHRVENKPDGPAVMVAAPIPEPEVHTSWLKSTVVPIRKPVTEVAKPDYAKPNPICKDPADCGAYASWKSPCEVCRKAAREKGAA